MSTPNPRLAAPDNVGELIAALRAADRVALDTEFHAERRWLPRLYLLQLGLPDGSVWVVDPLIEGLLPQLADALMEPTWVVHAGDQDLRILQAALGQAPTRVLDTQVAAGLVAGEYPASLTHLVRHWLGVDLAKTLTMSDWSKRPLSAEQLAYAAEDVSVVSPLWDALERDLDSRGRGELARSACDEARMRALNPADDHAAWRRMAAVPSLDPEALPVLQELAAWRELQARTRNQPVRAVVGDGALVELARRRPSTVGELTANRRLPKTIARHADEVLERIARAAARPPEAWPRAVRRGSQQARALSFLEVYTQVLAEDQAWAARLVAPRSLLEAVVLAAPATRIQMADALGDWRDHLGGEGLWGAWTGERGLRLTEGSVARTGSVR